MEPKYEITIRNNDEGFIGEESDENIDVDASVKSFNKLVTDAITAIYPDANVTMEYGPYSGRSLSIESDSLLWSTINDMEEEISEIISEIYNNGNFWTEK